MRVDCQLVRTASRDLGDLVSKDCLSVEGVGREIRYVIKLGTPQRNMRL